MNEPRRLLDDGTAYPELVRLLSAARAPRPLDPSTFERSRNRVVALGSLPAALGVLVWVKHAALGAVLGVAVAVAATAPRFLSQSEEPGPAPPAPGLPAVSAEAPPGVTPDPVALEPSVESSREPPAPAAPSTGPGGLAEELALLEAARAELDRRPGSALSLLARHEREFPRGTLAVEREFLTVSALVRLGRRREAETQAAALRARSPGSLYEQRLDAILGDAGGGF